MSKYDIIIIGSGLGGLECGAILSKEGFNVCVVEKNAQFGGCFQTYQRKGHLLDTGIHYVGSLDEGQVMNQYFRYFGIMDKLKIKRLDDAAFDTIYYKGKTYDYAMGYPQFIETICHKPCNISKALYTSLTGLSPLIAEEICYRASIDGSDAAQSLNETAATHLYHTFRRLMDQVVEGDFTPNIIYRDNEPVEYAVLPLTQYGSEYHSETFPTVSSMLETYYASRDTLNRIRQKSSDLRRIVQTALERNRKKLILQQKQMKDTAKKDKYKVYGELLTTYGYELKGGEKSLTCDNYYTNEPITIPLDENKSAVENAKRYFEKYAKLKRTFEALTEQTKETKEEIDHLNSISNALDIAREEEDLAAIRKELSDTGYVRHHFQKGKQNTRKAPKSKPLHYISSDGFHMYVGKNNYQNDELTFKFATGNDWWFHAKAAAGSHVIVKTEGNELPDRTFEEAARLAAHYSKAREQEKAEIDYVQKKHIKKPNGAKPGFVVYYTNYSMTISTDITGIEEAE